MFSETGFLLSYIRYGDNDAILNCFTLESGFRSFFAKGIYASKNKKKAYLLPLNELTFFYGHNPKGGQLEKISKLDLVKNIDFGGNVKSMSVIFFVADFLNQILRQERTNQKLYRDIELFLEQLERGNYSSHFVFLLRILENSGVLPSVNSEAYLNPETGIFAPAETHHLFNKEISSLWKELIQNGNSYSIVTPITLRKTLLESILVYYHYHFTDFRTPNSLEIVQQIFEN